MHDEPAVFIGILLYTITTSVFLLNLLIAQLNGAMLGYARLICGKIMTETLVSVSKARWDRFTASLRLCVEFGEGDIGVPGGV